MTHSSNYFASFCQTGICWGVKSRYLKSGDKTSPPYDPQRHLTIVWPSSNLLLAIIWPSSDHHPSIIWPSSDLLLTIIWPSFIKPSSDHLTFIWPSLSSYPHPTLIWRPPHTNVCAGGAGGGAPGAPHIFFRKGNPAPASVRAWRHHWYTSELSDHSMSFYRQKWRKWNEIP